MIDRMSPPRKVLAVMDESADQSTLASAAALADRHGAELEIFACIEPPQDIGVLSRLTGQTPDAMLGELRARVQAKISDRVQAVVPDREVPVQICTGKTFIEVIRHVLATGIDFVIKAAEPPTGVQRFLFTSTDQHLLRKCPCPVWLLTRGATATPRRVLAAVDVDAWDAAEPDTLLALNRRVLDAARQIAAPDGAEISVLHAWDAMGEGMVWAFSSSGGARSSADAYTNAVLEARHQALSHLVRDATADAPPASGIKLTPRLVRGSPEQVIEEQSRVLGSDVVVIGTVARTGVSGVFIGNTAENIINRLECPVLAVKPVGFVSPLAKH